MNKNLSDYSMVEGEDDERFILNIDGYEGPLDLLLAMARTQKLDLREISVLELAENYLQFVETAKTLRIELAADYLVMAAWLAYLKSRLLLPQLDDEDGPSAEELAEHLAFQLERLAAMRDRAAQLMTRAQMGVDFFPVYSAERFENVLEIQYTASLFDLLSAYTRAKTRDSFVPLHYERGPVLSMEEALDRMRGLLGSWHEWGELSEFIPLHWRDDPKKLRSAYAAHFAASLQLVKEGQLEIQQEAHFSPLSIRSPRSNGE